MSMEREIIEQSSDEQYQHDKSNTISRSSHQQIAFNDDNINSRRKVNIILKRWYVFLLTISV